MRQAVETMSNPWRLNYRYGPAVSHPRHLSRLRQVASGRSGGVDSVIIVTQLDGKKMALNTERIERIEHNESSDTTNVYIFGGSTLILADPIEELIEKISDSQALVVAKAFVLADQIASDSTGELEKRRATLHVLRNEESG